MKISILQTNKYSDLDFKILKFQISNRKLIEKGGNLIQIYFWKYLIKNFELHANEFL